MRLSRRSIWGVASTEFQVGCRQHTCVSSAWRYQRYLVWRDQHVALSPRADDEMHVVKSPGFRG